MYTYLETKNSLAGGLMYPLSIIGPADAERALHCGL